MSDDLVKRLRWLGDHASFEPHMHHTAADRIEKLEAALRDVLTDLEGENWLPDGLLDGYIYVKARKALEGKDDVD